MRCRFGITEHAFPVTQRSSVGENLAFCHIVACDSCMLDSGLHRLPAGITVRALFSIDFVECKALLDPTVHAHHLRFPLKQRNSCMGFALHDF